MIEVITKFIDKATVLIIVEVRKNEITDNSLTNATGVTISIWDPEVTLPVVDDGSMGDPVSLGTYHYYYHKGTGLDPMAKGNWRIGGLVADGTLDDTVYTPFSGSFEV